MKSDFVKQFQTRRDKMIGLLVETRDLVANVDFQTTTITPLIEQLRQATFKVLVIGEFKRGKSTFINALLGEKILPSAAAPCTAIISEVKYGAEKGATIYFNDSVEELPKGLAEDIVKYINQHKAKGAIPPLEVPFERLKDYVTIHDDEATDEGEDADGEPKKTVITPFKRAEIHIPLDLCKNGVEIIDSPGLNEQKTRTDIATGYVDEADAIIFVLSCEALAGQTERKAIKDFEQRGNRSIFFICNRFDNIDEDEREEIRARAKKILLEHTDLKERGLYFVSAKQALKARTSLDLDPQEQRDLEARSGFQQMEEGLRTFLGNDRGRVKLSKPGELLLKYLKETVPAEIGNECRILASNLEEVEAKYKTLLKGLEEIERGITQDHKALQGWLAQIRECFHGKLIEFYAFLAENISAWVDECDSAEVFDCPWTSEKQVKRIAKELADYAKQKAEAAAIAWSEEELAPSIKEACEAFQQEVNACLRNLHERISDAKGQFFDSRDGDEQAMDLDFLEAYGFKSDILGDTVRIGTSYLGALGLSVLGFLIAGPLGWIGFVAGFVGLFLREGFAAEEKMKKLKQEVGQKLVNAIHEKQAETIKEAVETFPIFGTLERAVDQFKKAAGKYVADIKDQAEKAKRLCGESEQKRDQREKSLKDTLRKAEALSVEVQGLLREMNA